MKVKEDGERARFNVGPTGQYVRTGMEAWDRVSTVLHNDRLPHRRALRPLYREFPLRLLVDPAAGD